MIPRSFDNDLAEFYGLPHEALAKILQRLARLACCSRATGSRADMRSARNPRHISIFDVIKASEGPSRGGIHEGHWRHLESIPGHHQLRMVSQLVEGMLRELTIEDIEEKTSSRTEEEQSSASHPAVLNTHST